MILSEQDIAFIIDNNPNQDRIKLASDQYEELRMHCTGEGIEDYVEDIKEFMREGQRDTLIDLMRGNRDLVSRIMAPREKIYYAKGGVEQYNLPEDKEPDFIEYLSDITEGLPYKEWIRQKVQPHFDYDPNGIIFIEINEDNVPYPTVRCILDIYDYECNGRALEYVFFKVSAAEIAGYKSAGMLPSDVKRNQKVYRVIDDTTDRLVICKYGNTDAYIASEVVNEFGYVPAMIISDMWGYGDNGFDSPLSSSIELLNAFMFSTGTFSWAYMREVFPKEWMQMTKCITCDGHKENNGQPCPECKGSGLMPYMRMSDVYLVNYAQENGEKIPNPPFGVNEPPVEALQFMVDNGMRLEDYIEYTLWGVSRVQQNSKLTSKVAGHGGNVSNTAYEAQLNHQPQHDKLKLFSKWKDSVQKFIANTCGWYLYRNQWDGCAILGGDRYMIESPDATWDRYTLAVTAKAPMSILDSLLMEYIENKYNNNPLLYRKYMLLMQVEPFVHESVDVIWIDMTLPMTQRLEKKYYDEWTSTLTDYDIASVPDEGGADILRKQLSAYVMNTYVEYINKDTLLLTNSGEILDIGDQVQVRNGKEQKPEHTGKIYTVADVKGLSITLADKETDGLFGYKVTDVSKSQKLIAA